VSFAKGCFVGQEVVSRMQNRSHVRKRIVAIVGDAPLLAGAAITAGSAVIGTVGSVAGSDALALVRLDRAAEAAAKGTSLMADGVAIALRKPDWANFELAPAATTGVS
jgi:tRNA-modifying protein YgfZ